MPVTNYHVAGGRMLGETTSGVRTDYLSDDLGSVVATVDQGQAVASSYRYRPFGSVLAKAGAGSDPRFLYFGQSGYETRGDYVASEGQFWSLRNATLTGYADSSAEGPGGRGMYAGQAPGQRPECTLKQGYPVPYKTRLDPYPKDCGDWTAWMIRWLPDKLPTKLRPGLIIQYVTHKFHNEPDCVSGVVSQAKPEAPFFEVWEVRNGNQIWGGHPGVNMMGLPMHDIWNSQWSALCTVGSYMRMDGYAKYYPVPTNCWDDWGWEPGKGPPRHSLVGGTNTPPGWDPTGATKRFVHAGAHCCDMEETLVGVCPPVYQSIWVCKNRETNPWSWGPP